MARKWENFPVIKRMGSSVSVSHFVVYTADQKRFLIPLVYLKNVIFIQLLKLSEEFGLEVDGPIKLPCDASFMEYTIMLIEQGAAKDLRQALLIMSVDTSGSSPLSLLHGQ